jgi:hypothetical protein
VLVVIDELLPREGIPSVGGVRNVIDDLPNACLLLRVVRKSTRGCNPPVT